MYNTDKPIETAKEDILGRAYFAKKLGKAILSFKSNDNMVLGLFGRWGSGKTSIINILIKEVEEETKYWTDEEKPIIFRFEPWNFSDNENLIILFFKMLQNKLNSKENVALKKNIGEFLEQYSDAFELANMIPAIGSMSTILKLSASFAGKQLKKKYSKVSIDALKEKIINILRVQKKKIIVVIDDIDRLSNEQIRMIFQLVKQVASFPNITYILSMDKEVVIRALGDIQNCDGNDYLEKIIQIPFNIPELNHEKVQEFLFEKLNNIIDNDDEGSIDIEHWGKVYRGCIMPYIDTIRDVNRIINSFQFKYDISKKEVNFSDLIGITTLEIIQPKIFDWIIENKDVLIGGSYDHSGTSFASQSEKKKIFLDKFDNNGLNGNLAVQAISSLFPKFDKEVNYGYELIKENELRIQKRIACPERFSLYFDFNIDDLPISSNIINNSIFIMEESELVIFIDKINKNGNIILYLDELYARIDNIPYERIKMFVYLLFRKKESFIGKKGQSLFAISADNYTGNCIEKLLNQLKSADERFEIFNEIIKNGSIFDLESISQDLNRIELGYGRLAGTHEDIREQIITLEKLYKLEKAYAIRLKELETNDSIFQAKSFLFIKHFWMHFDLNECKKYFSAKLSDTFFKLKFICKLSELWTGTDGRGWTFSKANYEDFVTDSEIIQAINSLDKKRIQSFNEEELLKLASFVLNQEKSFGEHPSEKSAKEYVNKWLAIVNKLD